MSFATWRDVCVSAMESDEPVAHGDCEADGDSFAIPYSRNAGVYAHAGGAARGDSLVGDRARAEQQIGRLQVDVYDHS